MEPVVGDGIRDDAPVIPCKVKSEEKYTTVIVEFWVKQPVMPRK